DNSSLDGGGYSAHSYATAASLPAGAVIWANDGASDHAVMFSMPLGAGTVVYSTVPLDHYMGGGNNFAAMLAPNSINTATTILPGVITTCASEGYTGTKLTWCKNICEKGYTGAALDTWIHRWISKYRDLPYCAVEGGGEQAPPEA